MSEILTREFENLDQWRQGSLKQLESVEKWLHSNQLMSERVASLLSDMRSRLLATQLKVAFVAEFSRGKSELINAIFFASGGRRIMPASVGRTTMCPVEVGYDAALPACIRLLPLETRLQDISLTQWRYEHPEAWVEEPLNIDDAEQLAATMAKVGERQFVTPKEATALGLWDEDTPQDNPSVNALGMVEIPKWRHAIVNYPHPLLKRGISILDTPGLNTVGVEPELTLELLPQAHAIMFLLAADTGVTRSDLQIWKDYLSGPNVANRPCYVILNKIDVLWDGLLSAQEAAQQLAQQRETCASLLNVPLSRILPVSAQKGLLGKIKNDFQLLQDSKLPFIERLLVRDLLPQRQQILRDVLNSGIHDLQIGINERLANQQKELKEQFNQFKGVSGKNEDILRQISEQIIAKKEALTALRKQSSVMRQAQKRKLWLIQKNISHNVLDKDIAELAVALKNPGMRLNLSKVFNKVIEALYHRAVKIEQKVREFETLLIEGMGLLEQAYGIDLTLPVCPGSGTLVADVEMLKVRYENFFGLNQALKMRRGQYAEHMFRTLLTRIRSIFDEMYDMLNMWSNNSYSVLVAQAEDKDQAIKHLYENIQRAQGAKEPLEQRIKAIEKQETRLYRLQSEFDQLMHSFSRTARGYAPLQNLILDNETGEVLQDKKSAAALEQPQTAEPKIKIDFETEEQDVVEKTAGDDGKAPQEAQENALLQEQSDLDEEERADAAAIEVGGKHKEELSPSALDDEPGREPELEPLEPQPHEAVDEPAAKKARKNKIASHPAFDLTLDLPNVEDNVPEEPMEQAREQNDPADEPQHVLDQDPLSDIASSEDEMSEADDEEDQEEGEYPEHIWNVDVPGKKKE